MNMNERIRYGHGYDNPTMGDRKPCDAFKGFEPIAEPLGGFSEADRERRVFPSGFGPGVTYGSHAVKLGLETDRPRADGKPHQRGTLGVMMHHGGGRQLSPLRIYQKLPDVVAGLQAMDEAALYFLLYAISETADNARRQGVEDERFRWLRAGEEGRIRKRRAKGGRAGYLDVFEPWEMPRGWKAPANDTKAA